jgi:hypothetical protein
MSKRNVKVLFGALIIWEILQYAIAAKFGEPYPALIMPGFSGTLVDREGNIRTTNVKCEVRFQDGSRALLSPQVLLAAAPTSNRLPIMAQMFSEPAGAAEPWPPTTFKARLSRGRTLSRVRHTQKQLDGQTLQWLKQRFHDIFPARDVVAATFLWYEDVFNVTGASPIASMPTGLREVQFQ